MCAHFWEVGGFETLRFFGFGSLQVGFSSVVGKDEATGPEAIF